MEDQLRRRLLLPSQLRLHALRRGAALRPEERRAKVFTNFYFTIHPGYDSNSWTTDQHFTQDLHKFDG